MSSTSAHSFSLGCLITSALALGFALCVDALFVMALHKEPGRTFCTSALGAYGYGRLVEALIGIALAGAWVPVWRRRRSRSVAASDRP